MRLLSTCTMANDVAKHKNNANYFLAKHKNNANDVAKHKNNANEVPKHKNDAK